MKLIIHTDGGARGNPGPAAVGVVIEEVDSGKLKAEGGTRVIEEFGKVIGEATNNVAEYRGVIEALKKVQGSSFIVQGSEALEIQFFLDSLLVVNQLMGVFQIKDVHLRELFLEVKRLEQKVGGVVRYTAVRREHNTRADFLVNQALDGRLM